MDDFFCSTTFEFSLCLRSSWISALCPTKFLSCHVVLDGGNCLELRCCSAQEKEEEFSSDFSLLFRIWFGASLFLHSLLVISGLDFIHPLASASAIQIISLLMLPLRLVLFLSTFFLRESMFEPLPFNVSEEDASFFPRLTFSWLTPLFEQRQEEPLVQQQLPALPSQIGTHLVCQRLLRCWMQELQKAEPSLLKALWRCFGLHLSFSALFKLINDACIFSGPVLLHALVGFLSQPSESFASGFLYSVALLVSSITMSFSLQHYYASNYKVGMSMKGAVAALVFRKSLSITRAGMTDESRHLPSDLCLGRISFWSFVFLFLSSPRNQSRFTCSTHFLWHSEAPRCLSFRSSCLECARTNHRCPLYFVVANGRCCLCRAGCDGCSPPSFSSCFLFAFASFCSSSLFQSICFSDVLFARCSVFWWRRRTGECKQSLNPSMQSRSSNFPRGNGFFIHESAQLVLKNCAFFVTTCCLMLLNLCFGAVCQFSYLLLRSPQHLSSENPLPNSVRFFIISLADFSSRCSQFSCCCSLRAFTTLSLVNLLTFPLAMLPYIVNSSMEALVSLSRLQLFLLLPESVCVLLVTLSFGNAAVTLCYLFLQRSTPLLPPPTSLDDHSVAVRDGSFAWNGTTALQDVTFSLPPSSLSLLIGQTGSGKSALLLSLIGELSSSSSSSITLRGSLAFCDQLPWIQNCSLRANILFGRPFDARKYERIIRACALEADLAVLPAGGFQ